LVFEMLEELRANSRDGDWNAVEAYYTLADAITHDVHEGVTGDVLYTTKRWDSIINSAIEGLEELVNADVYPDYALLRKHSRQVYVKAADMAELLVKLNEELNFGNRFPNIRAIWLFSYFLVMKFQAKLKSKVLQDVLDSCKSNFRQHTPEQEGWCFLVEKMPELNYWKRLPHGDHYEAGGNYQGFKLLVEHLTNRQLEVAAAIDKNKKISWGMLIQPMGGFAKGDPHYFVCRATTNHEERLILVHVQGDRSERLEKAASEVVLV
jgi:hypothetical protein